MSSDNTDFIDALLSNIICYEVMISVLIAILQKVRRFLS